MANSAPSRYKYKQKFKFNSVVSKISQNLPLETNRCCTQYYIFTNWKIQRNVYPQSLVRFSIFRKVFRWELSLKVFHKVWFSVLNITQSFSAENCLYIAKIRKLSLKVSTKFGFGFPKFFRLRIVFEGFSQSLVSVFHYHARFFIYKFH